MGSAQVRILGVDPGGTTGWVYYDTDTEEFQSGQEADRLAFCGSVKDWVDRGVELVVVEDFRITIQTAKKSQQPDALKIIGAIDYIAAGGSAKVVLQTPGDAKRFATDDRLKKAGMWTPGRRHANDAARHLFLRLCKQGTLNALEVDARAAG